MFKTLYEIWEGFKNAYGGPKIMLSKRLTDSENLNLENDTTSIVEKEQLAPLMILCSFPTGRKLCPNFITVMLRARFAN